MTSSVAASRFERLQQVDQPARRRQIPTVRTQVDAGEPHFPEPGFRETAHLVHDLGDAPAAPRPSRARHDAVGALLVAPRLHVQRIRSPAAISGPQSDRNHSGSGNHSRSDYLGDLRLSGVGHEAHDARQARHIVGLPRGVAPGRHDLRARIGARHAPDCTARRGVRRRRHRAGIDHHDVRRIGRGRHTATRLQVTLDLAGLGLVGPAAEGEDGESHRASG